jgi:phasin
MAPMLTGRHQSHEWIADDTLHLIRDRVAKAVPAAASSRTADLELAWLRLEIFHCEQFDTELSVHPVLNAICWIATRNLLDCDTLICNLCCRITMPSTSKGFATISAVPLLGSGAAVITKTPDEGEVSAFTITLRTSNLMDKSKTTTTKSDSSPQTDAPRAFSEMAEKGAVQTQEAYKKMSAASTETADLIKASSASALKGLQDYNNKFLEFAHTNSNAAFGFMQKLHDVESPSGFVELSTEHARTQTQALTVQTKVLAELAQKIAIAGAKPLQDGLGKAFSPGA